MRVRLSRPPITRLCTQSRSKVVGSVPVSSRFLLVHLGERTRPVSFVPGKTNDVQVLAEATKRSFRNVVKPDDKVVLQLKSDDWGGIFASVRF